MSDAIIFDRIQVSRQRDRAAPHLVEHDFLLRESGALLVDRLQDVTRRFPRILNLGCHGGELAPLLQDRFGCEQIIHCDLSPRMIALARQLGCRDCLVADEEMLPFAPASFDLVISNLSLHWVNDLPGALLQIRHILKPDGLFLGALLGGETLAELRHCLMQAELAEEGGAGPRISPFVDVKDGGALLQRAGFALPVADKDQLQVTYQNPLRLMLELRRMGEGNAIAARRRHFSRRTTLLRAMQLYQEQFADSEDRIMARFHIITLTGWRLAGNSGGVTG